jgi:uncharacterized protein YprB with RNaseH-like and TPR domain
MNIIVYDEETTGLDAEKDVLVHGYKWLGKAKIYTPSVLDYAEACNHGFLHYDEEPLIKEIHRTLSLADGMVTFNGKNFDFGVLQTKFMYYRLPVLQPMFHVDLYQIAKTVMRIRPKSLKNIARYLNLRNQKMELPFEVWEKAAKGDMRSLKTLRKRAASDVLMTEELYLEHLRPYVRQHPRINGYDACRRCGHNTLQRRGPAITIYRGQQYKFQCQDCGGWETRALSKQEKEQLGV